MLFTDLGCMIYHASLTVKDSDMEQRQKVAIVTGGGTGIGLGCAQHIVNNGWRVICAGLDSESPWPSNIEFRSLDVTDEDAVKECLSDLPMIDGLVNCAGIILHDQLELTPSGFNAVVNVNLLAVNMMTLSALDALKAARGSVVNIASMWSYFGSPRNPAYSASKGGVAALTRSHAVAFAKDGIRVNAIAPGWIDTRLAAGAIHNPERSNAIMSRIPIGRWGEPQDIAKVAGFLLSDEAAYVTGIVIPVDGGFGIA
jgi:NAD(P)-dependent dehydrogenase (short-subunit alcohol dehydrogenase family)